MDVQFHCVIIKRLQLKRKKSFFPYKRLRCSTRSISQGTEVTIVTEYVFSSEGWEQNGLYEFFQAKIRARRKKEQDQRNRWGRN